MLSKAAVETTGVWCTRQSQITFTARPNSSSRTNSSKSAKELSLAAKAGSSDRRLSKMFLMHAAFCTVIAMDSPRFTMFAFIFDVGNEDTLLVSAYRVFDRPIRESLFFMTFEFMTFI